MRNLYWGETHDNTYQAPDPEFSIEGHLAAAASHLDFYTAAYYPYTSPAFKKGGHPSEDKGRQPLNVERWKDDDIIAEEWDELKRAIRACHAPGDFVAFAGYEWQGDGTWGDHNVFFNSDDPPLFREDTLAGLYSAMRQSAPGAAFAIPHHTAYIRGFRGKNWEVQDDGLSPFAELFSIHGSSEGAAFGAGLRSNPFLGPDAEVGSISSALFSGRRIGIVGSTDNWGPLPGVYGQGLAGVWADELSREGLWEAFAARRVYGVTGDRIRLHVDADGSPMGSVIPAGSESPRMRMSVEALGTIDYIDVIRDEKLIGRYSPLADAAAATRGFSIQSDGAGDAGAAPNGGNFGGDDFQIRLEYGWGPPANVIELDARHWSGAVKCYGGASIQAVSPCFISPGQRFIFAGPGSTEFTFSGPTGQDTVNRQVQNAYVLRVKGPRSGVIEFEIDGMRHRASLEDLHRSDSVLWDRESSAQMIRREFSVDVDKLYRKDVHFGMAYKAKIHRAVGSSGFRKELTWRDQLWDSRPHHYRVRVRQINGQMAWSSPIWVE
jgi:hypothetical protein